MKLQIIKACPWFEALPKGTQEFLIKILATTRGASQISTLPVGDTLEIPKSPQMLSPKKDPQVVGLVHMPPQNPRFGKMSMEDKDQTTNIESDDEEQDPPTSVD